MATLVSLLINTHFKYKYILTERVILALSSKQHDVVEKTQRKIKRRQSDERKVRVKGFQAFALPAQHRVAFFFTEL